MKHVIIRALLKAAASFLLLIALTISYQYVTWLQYDPLDYANGCIDCHVFPETKAARRAMVMEMGLFQPFKPDLWPFKKPTHSW